MDKTDLTNNESRLTRSKFYAEARAIVFHAHAHVQVCMIVKRDLVNPVPCADNENMNLVVYVLVLINKNMNLVFYVHSADNKNKLLVKILYILYTITC